MEELSASLEKSFSRSYVLSKNYIVAGERRLDWWIKERHAHVHCEQASKLSGEAERKSPPSPPSSSTIIPRGPGDLQGTPRLKRSLVATTKR